MLLRPRPLQYTVSLLVEASSLLRQFLLQQPSHTNHYRGSTPNIARLASYKMR